MKFRYLLLISALACYISSCKPDNHSPQSLIVGNWTLQQQHVVQYTDNVQKIDTVYTAGALTAGNMQFNTNGTYTTQAHYAPDNVLQTGGSAANTSKANGTYTYANNVLTLSLSVSGWYSYLIGSSGPPTPITNTVALTSLTATTLDLHTVTSFNYTTSTTHNFKVVGDLHYTKQTSL